jgi:lipoteichoic acid synthase
MFRISLKKIKFLFNSSRNQINALGNDWLFLYSFFSLLTKNILCTYFILTYQNITSSLTNIFIFHAGSIFNYCSYVLIPLSFLFFFKNKSRLIAFIIINLLFSIFLLSTLWYARAFGDVPSVQQLAQMIRMGVNPAAGPGNLLIVIHLVDVFFIFDIFFIIFLIILLKNKDYYTQRSFFSCFFVLLFSFCLIFFVAPAVEITVNRFLLKQSRISIATSEKSTTILSPIGYSFYKTGYQLSEKHYTKLSEVEKEEIITWFKNKKENIPDNEYKAIFKGKNLIIIQVESLEKFTFNQKVDGQEITPNLNRLANNGLFFSNIYEQVALGGSSDADFMTNTSIYPSRKGITYYLYPFAKYNSLPKLLGRKGYDTFALYPFDGSLWNWSLATSSMGFEHTFDSSIYDMSEKLFSGLSDGSYFRQVEPIIQSQKQPFFFFLWTNTTHSPFILPSQYKELALNESLGNSILGNYFQVVHYTDKQIGLFIDDLETKGLLNNTVIVIYGDHEGIHKFYQKEISEINPTEDWWQNNNKHIPLIIYQNQMSSKEISTIGGQIDIMPTISYLIGIDENEYIKTAMGRNLLKTEKSFVVLGKHTFISDKNSENEKNFATKGLDISDNLMTTNSFEEINR